MTEQTLKHAETMLKDTETTRSSATSSTKLKSGALHSTDISLRIASSSSETSTQTTPERCQFLWDLTFLCWD